MLSELTRKPEVEMRTHAQFESQGMLRSRTVLSTLGVLQRMHDDGSIYGPSCKIARIQVESARGDI
jgi:hypothetical protein